MAKWKLWLKFILTELRKNQQWYIQVYVALRRSTSLHREKEISVNKKVDANSVVQLCLLNIRSLRKQSCVRHDVNH